MYFEYLDYFEIEEALHSGIIDYDGLSTTQLATLNSIAANEYHYHAAQARYILMQADENYSYEEPIVEMTTQSSRKHNIISHSTESKSELKVHPNPAKDYFVIELTEIDFTKEISVNLVDASGNTIKVMKMEETTVVVPTNDISAGVYQLILIQDNKPTQTQKIIITE